MTNLTFDTIRALYERHRKENPLSKYMREELEADPELGWQLIFPPFLVDEDIIKGISYARISNTVQEITLINPHTFYVLAGDVTQYKEYIHSFTKITPVFRRLHSPDQLRGINRHDTFIVLVGTYYETRFWRKERAFFHHYFEKTNYTRPQFESYDVPSIWRGKQL